MNRKQTSIFDREAYEEFRRQAPSLGLHPDFLKDERQLRALFTVFRQGPPMSVVDTLQKLARVTNQVCALTIGQTHLGTGFLIGEKRVLTAFHVIKDRVISSIVCSFNNIAFNMNDVTNGRATPAAVARVGPHSEPDQHNVTTGHLDYAVLELVEAVGTDPRGFVDLTTARVDRKDCVYLVDHPGQTTSVVFAGGVVTEEFDDMTGLVFFHSASADHGASGAPVFNDQFEIMGLHRRGPHDDIRDNEAVSISQIITDINGH